MLQIIGGYNLVAKEVVACSSAKRSEGKTRICRRLVSVSDARDPKSLSLARRRYVPRLVTSSLCSRLFALLVLQILPLSSCPSLLVSFCFLPLAFSCILPLFSFSSSPLPGPSSWLLSLLSLGRALGRIS